MVHKSSTWLHGKQNTEIKLYVRNLEMISKCHKTRQLFCRFRKYRQLKFNDNSPLITNPKVFPSLCKVTSTVLKTRPDPCTAKINKQIIQNSIVNIFPILHTHLHFSQFKVATVLLVTWLKNSSTKESD